MTPPSSGGGPAPDWEPPPAELRGTRAALFYLLSRRPDQAEAPARGYTATIGARFLRTERVALRLQPVAPPGRPAPPPQPMLLPDAARVAPDEMLVEDLFRF